MWQWEWGLTTWSNQPVSSVLLQSLALVLNIRYIGFWVLDLFFVLFCFLGVRFSLTFTTKISTRSSLSYLLKFSFLIVFPLFSPTVGTCHYNCILSLALQNTVFWPTLLFTNLQKKSYVVDSSSHTFIRMYYTHSNKQPEGRTVSLTLHYAQGQVQNLFYIKDFSKHLLNSSV